MTETPSNLVSQKFHNSLPGSAMCRYPLLLLFQVYQLIKTALCEELIFVRLIHKASKNQQQILGPPKHSARLKISSDFFSLLAITSYPHENGPGQTTASHSSQTMVTLKLLLVKNHRLHYQ